MVPGGHYVLLAFMMMGNALGMLRCETIDWVKAILLE
jgi:hypothetical protein